MSDSDVSGGSGADVSGGSGAEYSDDDEEVDQRPKHTFEADSEAEEVDVCALHFKWFYLNDSYNRFYT